jgi:hypothetical protein
LVIRWPQAVPAPAAREMSRRLFDHRLPATWSLEQLSQIEALASWGAMRSGADAALHVGVAADVPRNIIDEAAAGEMARRLVQLRSSGMAVEVVHGSPELTGNGWPRTLRTLGVRGIVVDGRRRQPTARALPFGVWQFVPQAVLPQQLRWWQRVRGRTSPLAAAQRGLPALATIELAELGSLGSRAWREAGRTLVEAAEARASGLINVVGMSELTARFTQAHAIRPQRSILRTAA